MHELPCNPDFPIIVETKEGLWVAVQQRILQIKEPQPLHAKILQPESKVVSTLYTPSELSNWETFSNFP